MIKLLYAQLAIFAVIAGILGFYFERIMRNIYQIKREKRFTIKYVHPFQVVGEIILFISFMVATYYFIDEQTVFIGLTISFVILLELFRAFMYWVFDRETREYIMNLYSALFLLFVLTVIVFWVF